MPGTPCRECGGYNTPKGLCAKRARLSAILLQIRFLHGNALSEMTDRVGLRDLHPVERRCD